MLNTPVLFGGLWLLVFVLYYPAAEAGFVTDFTGWLDQVQNHSFAEHINRSNFKVVSMYQFTQLVTWFFYKLFGTNTWLWHLLFITMHVVNACLASVLFACMLRDKGVNNYKPICYTSAVLFCISPYMSEVIVWEPSFHYLQGMMMFLFVLLCVQHYIHHAKSKYIWLAGFVYILSTHSLEVFYITPWLVLSLALFYRGQGDREKASFSKVLLYFFVPQLLIFILRLVEYNLIYGDWVSRVGSEVILTMPNMGLGKGGKYIFNLLFLARYLPNDWQLLGMKVGEAKYSIYELLDTIWGICILYGVGLVALIIGVLRFGRLHGITKVMLMMLLWTGFCLILVTPLWFDTSMLVVYDRYSYFASLFLFMLVALALWSLSNKYLRVVMMSVFVFVNVHYTIKVNDYWGASAHIINNLLEQTPVNKGKKLVLLNIPEHLQGIPMIGAWQNSEYKLMHDLLLPDNPIRDTVLDVFSYNMLIPDDGVSVQMLSDSTVHVALHRLGSWWWYDGFGGQNYENDDYKLSLIDNNNYELTFKSPIENYTLLYQVGDRWKQVNVNKIGEVQQ